MGLKKALLAGVAGLAMTASAQAQYSNDGITIGVLTDMSGVYADVGGQGSVVAAQMALEVQRWREFGAEPIINRWKTAAHKPGTPLSVHDAGGARLSGTYDGLTEEGALRLRLANGTTHVVHAGDVMLEEN